MPELTRLSLIFSSYKSSGDELILRSTADGTQSPLDLPKLRILRLYPVFYGCKRIVLESASSPVDSQLDMPSLEYVFHPDYAKYTQNVTIIGSPSLFTRSQLEIGDFARYFPSPLCCNTHNHLRISFVTYSYIFDEQCEFFHSKQCSKHRWLVYHA